MTQTEIDWATLAGQLAAEAFRHNAEADHHKECCDLAYASDLYVTSQLHNGLYFDAVLRCSMAVNRYLLIG